MTIVETNVSAFDGDHPEPVDARVAQHLGPERGAGPSPPPLSGRFGPAPPLRRPLRLPLKPTSARRSRPVWARSRSASSCRTSSTSGPSASATPAGLSIGFESGSATSIASQARRGTRRPSRVRLIFWTRIPSRVARFLREVEWRTCSNFGMLEAGVDAGELEQPPQRRHPVVAQVAPGRGRGSARR